MKSLATHPIKNDIFKALREFSPLCDLVVTDETTLEGSIPVITPKLADVNCVACVYADPHQDLPYPRYTALAPIKVRPGAFVFVEEKDGTVRSCPLLENQIVVFDSHLRHWVDKPLDYPKNWDALSVDQKNDYKKKNIVVFAHVDFENYPSLDDVDRRLRSVFCLSQDMKQKPSRPKF